MFKQMIKRALRKMFYIEAPLLEWRTQDMTDRGGCLMTYARSTVGAYEIYWSDDSLQFLLSYPDDTPAELFDGIVLANEAAQSHYNDAYFEDAK